jgi:outer membrane protein OmpA-like peptidoglycan-associated protein
MMMSKTLSVVAGLALLAASSGCGMLSSPPTQREQTAGIGGLVGGATGAIIGSFAGSAVAGGLFGIPLGALAGYYIGDQMSRDRGTREARNEQLDNELAQLRQENERLKRSAQASEEKSNARAAAKSEQPAVKATPANAPSKVVLGFDFDKSSLNGSTQQTLSPIVAWLKDDSDRKVAVIGYTDNVGADTYNMKLAERRAKTVRDFLVKSGVDAADIEIRGMGEANPIAANNTEAGREKNRRVEIVPNGGVRTASAEASH